MKRYILVNGEDELHNSKEGFLKDLAYTEKFDIRFLPVFQKNKGIFFNALRKIVLSSKFKNIHWDYKLKFYEFLNIDFENCDSYFYIIPTASLKRIDFTCLKNFKAKHNNVFFVLLITDSLKSHSKHLGYVRDKIFSDIWDLTITYDEEDAEEFGFKYFGYAYFSAFEEVVKSDSYSDIYFVGRPKIGREDLIGEVYEVGRANNIRCNFKVVNNLKSYVGSTSLKTIKSKISYLEVVSDVKSTNCILEVLQSDQKVQTLRYFEAIAYNKKLLSNNPNLHTLPFYDNRFMKYFSKVEDIDWEWVKEKDDIDYDYNGEFSPVKMIEFIEKIL